VFSHEHGRKASTSCDEKLFGDRQPRISQHGKQILNGRPNAAPPVAAASVGSAATPIVLKRMTAIVMNQPRPELFDFCRLNWRSFTAAAA
jgi:hypothetical protein